MLAAFNLDPDTLNSYLKNINSDEIPEHILNSFWEVKKDLGSLPLGIAFFPKEGWFIVDGQGSVYCYFK